jgi:hypothetical protein
MEGELAALLRTAADSCTFEELSEVAALSEGTASWEPPHVTFTRVQIEAIYRDSAFEILPHIIDSSRGCISASGRDVIDTCLTAQLDLQLLVSHFSKYDRVPAAFGEVLAEPLDPFTFFRFMQELFGSVSAVHVSMTEERRAVSTIIERVIAQTVRLSKLEKMSHLNVEILKIARGVEGVNMEVFKPIVQECFINAVYHRRVRTEVFGHLYDYTIGAIAVDPAEYVERYRFYGTVTYFTMLLHSYVNDMPRNWFYRGRPMISSARQALLLLGEKVVESVVGSVPDGSLLVSTSVEFEKKYVGTAFANNCYIEINYLNESFVIGLSQSFLIPVFTKDTPLSVTLFSVKKDFDRVPIARIPRDAWTSLVALMIVPQRKSEQYQEKFKRSKSLISFQCGTITVTTTYSPPLQPVDPGLSWDDSDVLGMLGMHVDRLVHVWLTNDSVMEVYPPNNQYLLVVEFAIRYAVPTPTLYVMILKRLLVAWCHAESYLCAFASMFVCAQFALDRCQHTENEVGEMGRIKEFLSRTVPQFVLQHLSTPGLRERHGLLPLFVLLAFVIGEGDFPGFLRQVMESSRDNILHSVTSFINPEAASIASACETLAKRARQIKKFYEDASLPLFLIQWENLEPLFREKAISLIKMFIQLKDQASDAEIVKFILNFKPLYQLLEVPDEYNPFKLFVPMVQNWISLVGERMIQWVSRAIQFDQFEINNKRDRTSSSLIDMMTVFSQSFQFLSSLNWDDPSLLVFLETFLSLCVGTLRLYTEQLTFKMLSYFPVKLIQQYTGDSAIFTNYIPQLRKVTKSKVTPAQIFIIINNFMYLRPSWVSFLDRVHQFFPDFQVDERFLNPVPQVASISKSIPILFAGLAAQETTAAVGPHVWVPNSRVKTFLIRSASRHVLNPLFEQRMSDLFAELFDKTVNFLKQKIDALEKVSARPYYPIMLQGLLHGLDTGLINILVTLREARPIKHKRLLTLMHFFQDVLNDVKEHIIQSGFTEFTDQMFIECAPLTNYMIRNLERDPVQLIADTPGETNMTLALCNYFIIASRVDDGGVVRKWAKEQRPLYSYRTFNLSLNPQLA